MKLKVFTFNISPSFPCLPAVGPHESSSVPSALASGHKNVFISGEKKQNSAKKRAVSVHCVIFLPINTAGGYYIFNGYSINCSSFSSLSGAVELFDLMFRPPRLFDIIILQSRWIKLLQARKESSLFAFIKCKIACLQQINSLTVNLRRVYSCDWLIYSVFHLFG